MSKTATIVGSAAFVILIVGFFWFCKSQSKNLSNRNSETVEWNREAGQSSSYGESLFALHCPQQFTMEELEQATRKFNGSNLIGYGSFSQVYKGLLCYTIVAIKRQPGAQVQPQNLFLRLLSRKWIKRVYEYLPNGSMRNLLYNTGLDSSTRLEFKQRLTIALGAAKVYATMPTAQPKASVGT
ncbi:hypothetical protein SLEP1_g27889 [Rubroshorea leprosula]|uniref:non-specific serine/threonine protein kinase n=1 Tax=Rubroshorea leprosula TaxID=152421 RepID=A0AAV5JRZ5_9ROSI|nr:hypothetical protein SLEP1_g27889 [Rubroshorea leprosula]